MSTKQDQFVEELLKQMPELNSEQYTKYRSELDSKLERARREEAAMRWVVVGVWAAALLLWVAAVLVSLHFGQEPQRSIPEGLLFTAAEVVLLIPVAALLLLALYLFKYRRRISSARAQAQAAALGELQRQINELRAQLLPAQKDRGNSAGL
jgi:hypothetical protein